MDENYMHNLEEQALFIKKADSDRDKNTRGGQY